MTVVRSPGLNGDLWSRVCEAIANGAIRLAGGGVIAGLSERREKCFLGTGNPEFA